MHIPIATPLILFVSLLMGVLCTAIARRSGRDPYLWFWIGFFFGILGVFAVFFAPSLKKSLSATPKKNPVQAILLPTIQGPSDKFWYYLNNEHQQVGPMSLNGLNGAWRQGKISLKTYVWNEELPEWKPLQDLITSSP